jgi:hypothetical protein
LPGKWPVSVMARRLALALVIIAAISAAAWWWLRPRFDVGGQLAAYRVGQMASYAEASKEIAAIERSDDAARRELVGGWGTGNDRFDYYLARYVAEPRSSEALREAFSRELSWRPALLARWAHFWSWQVKQPPADEVASIRGYLAALQQAEPPRKLSWREVLALQAVFVLTDQADAAHRLDPVNWRARLEEQEQGSAFGGQGSGKKEADVSSIVRPETPLPDWRGAVPR